MNAVSVHVDTSYVSGLLCFYVIDLFLHVYV
jgi:hypothetical protein